MRTDQSTISVLEKWRGRLDVYHRYSHFVDAAEMCREVVADLESTIGGGGDDLLNLTEAAKISGFSADHLGRLVRQGKLPNRGRPRAPRIQRASLPTKAGYLPAAENGAIHLPTRMQTARAAVSPYIGGTYG